MKTAGTADPRPLGIGIASVARSIPIPIPIFRRCPGCNLFNDNSKPAHQASHNQA
jgi:hypothetical protein